MSLKAEASKGVLWVAVERFGQQILQAVIFIILARLLTPEDFGLIAMLMIFFAIAQSFIDSGMGQALIREKEITDQDRSTVFWFNLLLSVAFYGLLYVCAPWIAEFYDRPELVDLTRVMGLAVIFFGVAIVQRSEMTQQLEFKKQAYAQVPAVFIAGIVSITMAYMDFGVWSLVAQYLLVAACSSIALWILQPANIRFHFDKESFTRLFGFGYKLLLSGLLVTIYNHIYKLVIGKFFTASALGFYTQAKKLQEMLSNQVVSVIQKITYPLLSKARDDLDRLKRGYRDVMLITNNIIIPLMIVLFFLAEPIFRLILGEQWVDAAPFLRILCLSGLIYHVHSINLNLLKVLGKSELVLRLAIFKKIVTTTAIVIGLNYGIMGLLYAQVASSYINLGLNTYYTNSLIDYSYFDQLKDIFVVLIQHIPMILMLSLSIIYLNISTILMLIGILALTGIVYLFSNLLIKTDSTKLTVMMARQRLGFNYE